MELPLQHTFLLYFKYFIYYVSILVLMELPLQRESEAIEMRKSFCFNPCFNGTTSATPTILR